MYYGPKARAKLPHGVLLISILGVLTCTWFRLCKLNRSTVRNVDAQRASVVVGGGQRVAPG